VEPELVGREQRLATTWFALGSGGGVPWTLAQSPRTGQPVQDENDRPLARLAYSGPFEDFT